MPASTSSWCRMTGRASSATRTNLFERVADEALPVIRHHEDVDAGIHRLRALVLRAALHFVDAVPVADDEAVEARGLLQHVGDQVRRAVDLPSIPGVVRRHDRLHAGVDGRDVALPVNLCLLYTSPSPRDRQK